MSKFVNKQVSKDKEIFKSKLTVSPGFQKLLKNKLTHHHTEGDVISTALTNRGTIGRVKKIKSDDVNPLKKHSLTNWTDAEPEHEPHTEAEIMGE